MSNCDERKTQTKSFISQVANKKHFYCIHKFAFNNIHVKMRAAKAMEFKTERVLENVFSKF